MGEGTVTLGGVVSWTVAWKEPVAVLPWLSVAVQLTGVVVMVNVEPDAGAQMGVIAPSTRSKAEGVYETVAPLGPAASAIMLCGSVRLGGVVSCTITWKLPVVVLPWASVAKQVTVVVPIGKVEPDAGLHVGVRVFPKESDAVTVKVTVAPDGPAASLAMFAGRLRVGGVLIWLTVTSNEAVEVLPLESVAEQSMPVTPTGRCEPEAGEQDTGTEPSTKSVADGV